MDVTPFVAWRHGRIVFDNTPLETILGELSCWYDMKVIYLNEDAKKHSLFAQYGKNIRIFGKSCV